MKTSAIVSFRGWSRLLVRAICLCPWLLWSTIQAPAQQATSEAPAASPSPANREALEKKFQETLDHAVFVGRWSVVREGVLGPEREEKYSIQGASKVGGDVWLIHARIQYGKTDVNVPVPVQVLWAGDTPVISITNLGIPGVGTYTARVVVYDGFYAGTWSGGDHGGVLSGLIQKSADPKTQAPAGPSKAETK